MMSFREDGTNYEDAKGKPQQADDIAHQSLYWNKHEGLWRGLLNRTRRKSVVEEFFFSLPIKNKLFASTKKWFAPTN